MQRWTLILLLVGMGGCVNYTPAPIAPERTAHNFQSRSFAAPKLRVFVESSVPDLALSWPPLSWDLACLTVVAFCYNPDLDVARAQWDSATAAIRTAGARPNPGLGLAPGYNFNAENGKSPWFPGVTADIPIETAGKRGIRITRAERAAMSARINVTTAAWQLRGALRRSLIELTASRSRLDLLQAQEDVQRRIVELLEERQSFGAASTTEVSIARIALARLQVEMSEAERQRNEALSRIAETLGLPLSVVESAQIRFPLESDPKPLDASAMRRLALQRRSDIRAALADYAVSEADLEGEVAKQYPNLNLGTGYEWDQGENKWNLAFGVELPVLNLNQGRIEEAEAKRREAAARFRALQAKIAAEIDRAAAAQALAVEQLARARQVQQGLDAQLERMQSRLAAGDIDQLEFQIAKLEAATSALASLDGEIRVTRATGELENSLQIPSPALSLIEQSTAARSGNEKP